MASDYFVMFVMNEGSGPAQRAMLGPVVSDISSRGHLEEDFSIDSSRHMVDGSRAQVLIAGLCCGYKGCSISWSYRGREREDGPAVRRTWDLSSGFQAPRAPRKLGSSSP